MFPTLYIMSRCSKNYRICFPNEATDAMVGKATITTPHSMLSVDRLNRTGL